jgi:DNA-directed RNA polymerase subunit N (RpoN/RPB10)
MTDFLKFYNCPPVICSCIDENEDPTQISRHFRYFYEEVEKGKKSVDVLSRMGIKRMCCRAKFLSLPLIPMIDRSKRRFYNDVQKHVISEDTRELGFKVPPPEFPIL